MKRLAAIVATVLLTLAAIAFTVSNLEPVQVALGPWSAAVPLFAIMLASLLTGFLIGVLVAWCGGRVRRRQAREIAGRNAALLRQIEDLRRQPPAASGTQLAVGR